MPLPLISIIIPVHNVEAYLRECLDSVIHQTYTNLEIIIVNDCSPDNSQSIIDEYMQQDPRIQCIKHTTNKGLGEARNTGITKAKGAYLCFLDSDDYWDRNFVEKMLSLIQKNTGIDIALCNYQAFDSQTKEKLWTWNVNFKHTQPEIPFSPWDTKNDLFYKLSHTSWNKIYKSDFIKTHQLKFYPNAFEDVSWGYSCLYSANKLIYTEERLIHYRINRPIENISITQNNSLKTSLGIVKELEILFHYLQRINIFKQVEEGFLSLFYNALNWRLYQFNNKDFEVYYTQFQQLSLKINLPLIENLQLNKKEVEVLSSLKHLDAWQFILTQHQQLQNQHQQLQQLQNQHQQLQNQYSTNSIFNIIKNRIREKIVHEKWAKYPKFVRYGIYMLSLIRLFAKNLISFSSDIKLF